uniref:TctD-like protein n=1 Tax=Sporolithon durum TaxID=48970 RepID=A0A141SD47_9FLOR|nr:hypothetical protein Sdur_178 [Sporolithon durum]AMK96215.1 hypothetical protein Sdur_178 [Sporolithon durum]
MCKQILLVDDDLDLAYAIKSYLSLENKKVTIVDNSRKALDLLNICLFDLVITDIMMPHMNGYELIVKIRQNMKWSNIPIICLTAKGMTQDRIKGYNLGCNAYLTKPFHPSELLSIIDSIFYNINLLKKSVDYQFSIEKELSKSTLSKNGVSNLTPREISVLKLLIRGLMNKEIASCLKLSTRNVEKYVSRLLNKTKTRNRTELAQFSWSNIMKANDGTRTRE